MKKIEIVINHHLNFCLKIKFTFRKDLKLAETALLKHDLGDRQTVLAHQGGAVVPGDDETSHEEIRPGTHLLVRTEVSRLKEVG